LGIGDWGLGIGDWGLGPIPNPQSPIPNYQEITVILFSYKIEKYIRLILKNFSLKKFILLFF